MCPEWIQVPQSQPVENSEAPGLRGKVIQTCAVIGPCILTRRAYEIIFAQGMKVVEGMLDGTGTHTPEQVEAMCNTLRVMIAQQQAPQQAPGSYRAPCPIKPAHARSLRM